MVGYSSGLNMLLIGIVIFIPIIAVMFNLQFHEALAMLPIVIIVLIIKFHFATIQREKMKELDIKKNILQSICLELQDTYEHIESTKDRYVREIPNSDNIIFTNAYFYHDTYDKLLSSIQIRSFDIDVNDIKKIVHVIKEHNRIWLKFDESAPDQYGDVPSSIDDDETIRSYCRRLEQYEKFLTSAMPTLLEKIIKMRDSLH